jgi:hypothetical protein
MTRHLFLPVDNSNLLKFRAKLGDVPPIPPYIFWLDGKKSYQKNNPPPIPTETRHLYLPKTNLHPPPIPPYQNWSVDNFTGRLFVSVRSQLSPP